MVDGQIVISFLHFPKAFVKPLLTYLKKKIHFSLQRSYLFYDSSFHRWLKAAYVLTRISIHQFPYFLVLISQL